MLISGKKLRNSVKLALRESLIEGSIIPERPWSIQSEFILGDGIASDSEGIGPDGAVLTLRGASGCEMRIVIDTYWNPHKGDQSGNSIKIESQKFKKSCYVPQRLDDGKPQGLLVTNDPREGLIAVLHSPNQVDPPELIAVVPCPFSQSEEISPSWSSLGNGTATARVSIEGRFGPWCRLTDQRSVQAESRLLMPFIRETVKVLRSA